MKRETLSLVIGFLLMGANLFAADGDLIVNGNVGIGTANPDYARLSIASGSGNTALGLNGYQLLKWDNNNQIHFGGYNSSQWQELHFYINAHERLTIKSTGIGIGTTTPGAALEINGLGPTFRIRQNYSASYWDLSHLPSDGSFVYRYNPGSGGTIVAKVLPDGTWSGPLSDLSLKENITPLENPVEKVKAINGITFTWKDQTLFAGQRVGVIADEVEKVLPEAVTMNEDGNKMISYDSLIPLLIEAVKEQQKAIESLQQELAAIKK